MPSHTQIHTNSPNPYCPGSHSLLNVGCIYFANLCWHLRVHHPHQFTVPAKGVWIIILCCIIWFPQVSLIRRHRAPPPSEVPFTFSALMYCLHSLVERKSSITFTRRFYTATVCRVKVHKTKGEWRQIGTDAWLRDADTGCPSLCHLGASVRSTRLQELSTCCGLSSPSTPPPSSRSQGKARVLGWSEVEAATAKQIYSGRQQSLLE